MKVEPKWWRDNYLKDFEEGVAVPKRRGEKGKKWAIGRGPKTLLLEKKEREEKAGGTSIRAVEAKSSDRLKTDYYESIRQECFH